MTRMDSRPLLALAALSFACALGTGCSSSDDDKGPCKDCVYPATGGSSPSPVPTDQQVGSGQQPPLSGNTGGSNGTGGDNGTGGTTTGGTGGTVGGAFGGMGGTTDMPFVAGGALGFGNGGALSSGGTVGNPLTGGTGGT